MVIKTNIQKNALYDKYFKNDKLNTQAIQEVYRVVTSGDDIT